MATPCSSDWNALISTEQYGSTNPSPYIASPLSSNYGMFELNNLSFPEIECSFDLSPERHTNSAHYTPDFFFKSKPCNDRNIKGRKRKSIAETSSLKRSENKDEKNEKAESSTGLGISKSASKQAMEISKDSDSTKEEYIHVRAKRGQAINRHSLAERVRREKISERMRVLQDLVPGCNKITGKAVMLDEIINYVQSLQKQVEFLSMKLAAVQPQLKLENEHIFSIDVQPPGRSPTLLGLSLGLNAQYHHFHGSGRVRLETLTTTTMPQLSTMSQIPHVWDEELQNFKKMVFIPHHAANYHSGFNDKDLKDR